MAERRKGIVAFIQHYGSHPDDARKVTLEQAMDKFGLSEAEKDAVRSNNPERIVQAAEELAEAHLSAFPWIVTWRQPGTYE